MLDHALERITALENEIEALDDMALSLTDCIVELYERVGILEREKES